MDVAQEEGDFVGLEVEFIVGVADHVHLDELHESDDLGLRGKHLFKVDVVGHLLPEVVHDGLGRLVDSLLGVQHFA